MGPGGRKAQPASQAGRGGAPRTEEHALSKQTQPEQPHYTRACPDHMTELVFRPQPNPSGGYSEIPWCVSKASHRCDYWLVLDRAGEAIAAATLRGYLPAFDPEAILADLAMLAGRRQMPAARESLDEVPA